MHNPGRIREAFYRAGRSRFLVVAALAFSIALPRAGFADERRAVVIGGGPNPKNNQVAIESNVRYLLRALPTDVRRTVLFADGDSKAETVLFEEREPAQSQGDRIVSLLLSGHGASGPAVLKYRAPNLAQLDGPARRADIDSVFTRLGEQDATATPLLLYFTGHGSPAKNHNLDNNVYDLWQDNGLSVQDLARQIGKLPQSQPVTIVMVQCYSGAFGNLLFDGGDPSHPPQDRDIAGFFATVKERVAAGCTPALDESEYHDFTSYFFAALTGQDRVGRKIRGADYNHDGRVSMDEAFCYSLIHDASIDIPICTSDVLLRRVVTMPDEDVFKTPYGQVRNWATIAQRAALEELSKKLKLNGDSRGVTAFNRFRGLSSSAESEPRSNPTASARRAFGQARDEARTFLIQRWPELQDPGNPGFSKARGEAAAYAGRQARDGKYKALLEADAVLDAAEEADYAAELADSLQTRFVRLYKSVVLAHALRTGSDAAARDRFERLVTAESQPLFTPSRVASANRRVAVGIP